MRRYAAPDPANPQVGAYGVVLPVTPTDATQAIEFRRAADDTGAPDLGVISSYDPRLFRESGDVFSEQLPNDGAVWWYSWRHVIGNGTPGAWTEWVGVVADLLPDEYTLPSSSVYPLRRDKHMVDGKHMATADDPDGNLLGSAVAQNDGISSRPLAKGYQRGAGRNGDAVTFAVPFQNAPMMLLRGGISYEPRAKWGTTGDGSETGAVDATKPQYDDLVALDLTASGFTLRGRLRQKGAQTAQKDDFAAGDLTALNDTVVATLVPAGASSDYYLVHFSVVLQISCALHVNSSGSITVAIETNDGSGWVERSAQVYSGTAIAGDCTGTYEEFVRTHEQIGITVSGLGSSDQLRLKIKDVTGSVYAFVVHAFIEGTDGTAGVTYNTATDVYASKTPDSSDLLEWEAIAVN